MPQVMDVQTRHADRLGSVWPAGQLVEVPTPNLTAPRARKEQRAGIGHDEGAKNRWAGSTSRMAA
jgi:hypothetical protein